MRRHVFPQAPSPTMTSFFRMAAISVGKPAGEHRQILKRNSVASRWSAVLQNTFCHYRLNVCLTQTVPFLSSPLCIAGYRCLNHSSRLQEHKITLICSKAATWTSDLHVCVTWGECSLITGRPLANRWHIKTTKATRGGSWWERKTGASRNATAPPSSFPSATCGKKTHPGNQSRW